VGDAQEKRNFKRREIGRSERKRRPDKGKTVRETTVTSTQEL
jgi:hypothetical protein